MNRTKKVIAIISTLLLLGTVIYQVNAGEGNYVNEGYYTEGTIDAGVDEEQDNVYEVNPIPGDMDDLSLATPEAEVGEWLGEEPTDDDATEEGSDYIGFAPMYDTPGALSLSYLCHYTEVMIAPSMSISVSWTYDEDDPSIPFTVSFAAGDMPSASTGWSAQRKEIRYTSADDILITAPLVQVGDRFYFEFPFAYTVWENWRLVPVIDVFFVPDPPSIEKEAPIPPNVFPVLVGETIDYTITITNPAVNPNYGHPLAPIVTTFDGFRVVDQLPPELSLIPNSVMVTGGTEVDIDDSEEDVIDVTFNLPGSNVPGHPVVITFQAIVTPEALLVEEIVNWAYLYHPFREEPTRDDERVPVAELPELDKEAILLNGEEYDGEPVANGDIITYRLRVHNSNDRVLNDFLVTDELPSGLVMVEDSMEVVPGTALVTNQSTGNVIYVVLNLPAESYVDIIFRARVTDITQAVDGYFVNRAYLHGPPDDEGDRPPVDDCEERVPVRPDISLEKSVYPTTANPGSTVSYTLVVRNTGGVELTNVVVTDDLPIQLTSPRNLVITPEGAGTGSFEGNLLTVTIPRLGVGEAVTITFDATVAANTVPDTTIVNVAEVTTDEGPYDEDDARVTVPRPQDPQLRPPGISLEKSVSSETVQAGGDLTYTIVVRNLGDVVLTNVEVTDELPAQLTNPRNLVITPANVGTGSFEGQLLTVIIPELGIDQVVTITFDVTVAAGVAGNTVIRNVASVTTDQGPSAEDDAKTTVQLEPPARQPGRAPLTGDDGILGNILFLFIVGGSMLVMMSLLKAEKKKMRNK